MFGLIKTWKALEAKGIMGINRRNADYVLKYNKRSLYPIVDDKIITKQRAVEAGIHVPEMYGIIETEKDIDKLKDIVKDHTDFVVKPAQGAGGDGILVIADRFEGRYKTVSGKIMTHEEIEHQISNILTGLYSLGGHRDRALIEYRVTPDPIFKSISYEGVPDIRIIVLMGYPIMAMLRLPTRQSGGKANLHQGAIGVGVDLATGITLRGTWEERGGGHAFKVAVGTLIAASLAFMLMNIRELTYFIFTFPAVLLIMVGFMLAMGRYRGYRLTELFRFKAFLKD